MSSNSKKAQSSMNWPRNIPRIRNKGQGRDLGWIIQADRGGIRESGFFPAARSISDGENAVRLPHHLVLERKRTQKPFDEVKDSIRAPLMLAKADNDASSVADQLATAIRKSNRTPLAELAKEYHLQVAQTRAVAANEPLLELGNSPEVKDTIFRLREGEKSSHSYRSRICCADLEAGAPNAPGQSGRGGTRLLLP
jgi:hypothetical protein